MSFSLFIFVVVVVVLLVCFLHCPAEGHVALVVLTDVLCCLSKMRAERFGKARSDRPSKGGACSAGDPSANCCSQDNF